MSRERYDYDAQLGRAGAGGGRGGGGNTSRIPADGSCPPELFDPTTVIEIQQENPKKKGSKSWIRYEAYKVAKTVGE